MSYLGKYEQRATNIKRFDVTSSTSATHTLTWVPVNEQSLFVTINGVKQQEDAYSVSGVILTLTDALVSSDKMEVIGIQDIGVGMIPPDNSITTAKIKDDAVTGAKIALGSDAEGDIMYYNGTDWVRLPKGAGSQTLKMNAGATAPEWVTV